MPQIDTINKIRSVEYGLTYLWNIRFTNPTPPSPFSDFFPATTMDEDIFSLESYMFEASHGLYKVPLKRGATKEIQLNFYDDVNNTLLNWFDEWVNGDDGIFDRNGSRVKPLEECVRQVQVVRQNANREDVGNPRTYWVYPEGKLPYQGDNDANVRSYPLTLVICGSIGNTSIA
jgi:hypothetical protein